MTDREQWYPCDHRHCEAVLVCTAEDFRARAADAGWLVRRRPLDQYCPDHRPLHEANQ